MKSLITLCLLFAIALSLFTYFSSAEDKSEQLIYLGMPVIIEALLLLIFLFSVRGTPYRKTIGVALIVWTVVLIFMLLAWMYLQGLAQAFKN
jgi:phosphatidylserine synthase